MMKDIVKENLGPVTIWNSVTDKGREFLLKICTTAEVKQEGGFTYFQVESRRNHEIENAAMEQHVEVATQP